MGKNYINPLCAVAGWGEVYMNASMESIVNGYEDPRGKKWYNTALLEGYQKQLLGIPIGLPMKDGDANIYSFCSSLNTSTIGEKTGAVLMSAAGVLSLSRYSEAPAQSHCVNEVLTPYS